MRKMRIVKLVLFNYRSFEGKHEFLFDKYNVILGDNGKGKSSILDALQLVFLGKTKDAKMSSSITVGKEESYVEVSGFFGETGENSTFVLSRKIQLKISDFSYSGTNKGFPFEFKGEVAFEKVREDFGDLKYSFISERDVSFLNMTDGQRADKLAEIYTEELQGRVDVQKLEFLRLKDEKRVKDAVKASLDGIVYDDVSEDMPLPFSAEVYDKIKEELSVRNAIEEKKRLVLSTYDERRGDFEQCQRDCEECEKFLKECELSVLELEDEKKGVHNKVLLFKEQALSSVAEEKNAVIEKIESVRKIFNSKSREDADILSKGIGLLEGVWLDVVRRVESIDEVESWVDGYTTESVGILDFIERYTSKIILKRKVEEEELISLRKQRDEGGIEVSCPECSFVFFPAEYLSEQVREKEEFLKRYDTVQDYKILKILYDMLKKREEIVCCYNLKVLETKRILDELEERKNRVGSVASEVHSRKEILDSRIAEKKKHLEYLVEDSARKNIKRDKASLSLESAKKEYDMVSSFLSDEEYLLKEKQIRSYDDVVASNAELAVKRKFIVEERKSLDKKKDMCAEELRAIDKTLHIQEQVCAFLQGVFSKYVMLYFVRKLEGVINKILGEVYSKVFIVRFSIETRGIGLEVVRGEAISPVTSLSGFEGALVNVAYALALSLLFGSSIFMLDEVDAQASDQNSEYMYSCLEKIFKRFNTVSLISHHREAVLRVFSGLQGTNIIEV